MRPKIAVAAVTTAIALASGCTSSSGGHGVRHCAGSDEIFQGEAGPCPPTGTLRGHIYATAGPSPGAVRLNAAGSSVTLERDGRTVAKTKADNHSRFDFTVTRGIYTVVIAAFGTTCNEDGVRVQRDRIQTITVNCRQP